MTRVLAGMAAGAVITALLFVVLDDDGGGDGPAQLTATENDAVLGVYEEAVLGYCDGVIQGEKASKTEPAPGAFTDYDKAILALTQVAEEKPDAEITEPRGFDKLSMTEYLEDLAVILERDCGGQGGPEAVLLRERAEALG